MERLDSTGDNACALCHDTIHIFAVGHCDHPVCYKCSTRMRVLCEQMDCPICRSTMPQVAFVHEKLLFKELNLRECIPNRKNKIFYESEEIEDRYLDLLEFRCRQCPKRKPERTFAQLQTHMRREHQLFACDICLAHLKIFPFETKFYDRKSLAVHRRMGDKDDKSYKGHPLCEFCDTRYLDKDELMKHLRKDHFFCHFCDQEGSNAYYNDYPDLLEHFGDSHFVCTEDECGNPTTRFTHAFSSEIDLKSHKATVHNKKSRETRTIEVDFQYAPRRQGYSRGNGSNANDYDSGSQRQYRNKGERYGNSRRHQEDPNLQRALEVSLQESVEAKARPPPVEERVPDPIQDFPTLSGLPAPQTQAQNPPEPQKVAVSSKREEDFPSLGSSNVNSKKPQNPSNKNYAAITHFTTEIRPVVKKEKPRESQPVSLGTIKTTTKERWAAQAPSMTEDDYPTLIGRSKPSHCPARASGDNSSSFLLQKSSVVEVPVSTSVNPSVLVITEKPNEKVSQQRRSVPVMRPISDEKEFPSLRGGASRQEPPVSGNILWLKKQNPGSNARPSQTPRSEKCDDESFELPDSYYNSYEPLEQHQASNKSKVESNSSTNSKKSVIIDKKEFPGLPKREAETKPLDKSTNSKQVKSEVKKIEPKIFNTGGKKSKKSKKGSGDKSLNDIAAGLINTGATNSQVNRGKNSVTDENGNCKPKVVKDSASVKASKPDWFDNPSSVNENENKKVEEAKKESVVKRDDNFPSLHAMSSSVQSTNAPPGFIPKQNISAPPGFSKSKPTPPGLSKPTFSIHDYIQPADFTNRNQTLVHSISFCLETVEDGFDNFKALSFQFRQGIISAGAYYTNCQLLIGDSDFKNIFPELLALLPDINKQQELWFEYQLVTSGQSGSRLLAASNCKNMSPCGRCGQIVLKEDLQHHSLQHGGDGRDFPSLRDATNKGSKGTTDCNANRPLKGAWIKAST